MLKEICSEKPELKAAYEKLTDEQKAKVECGFYLIGRALNTLIPFINTAIKAIGDFSKALYETHPNKRVVNLALYGKKQRTRKKNMNRIKKDFRRLENGGRKMD